MYLIDSNVLIEAKNRYYAFDIAPGFWEWLEYAHKRELVCSISAVYEELRRGDDELSHWAQDHSMFFRPIDQGTARHFPKLTQWAMQGEYKQEAKIAFTGDHADYLLVAYACEHKLTVVTHEKSRPQSRARILIPDACMAMGVATADPFNMLRKTGAEFHYRNDWAPAEQLRLNFD